MPIQWDGSCRTLGTASDRQGAFCQRSCHDHHPDVVLVGPLRDHVRGGCSTSSLNSSPSQEQALELLGLCRNLQSPDRQPAPTVIKSSAQTVLLWL